MTGRHAPEAGRLARAWAWWRRPPATLSRGFLALVAAWAITVEFAGPAGVRPLVLVGLAWLIAAALFVLWGFARGLRIWAANRRHPETEWTVRNLDEDERATITMWLDNTHARFTPEGNDPT